MSLKGKQMRYYLPLHEKQVASKSHVPSRMVPLWVWIVGIAVLLVVVLALR
jgi:type VI protein secretion system component VasF